ncbi:hypothetical protein A3D78_04030 [Candidatus Gottesmanbacteria bacterium RIFCSPHIGHO2_02_FULL_39_14]|uniref:Uncharacterized protein n=1 Tax=Candidatus Gottesmanbacteria bacterium RIFCSPHIGHO2_02_FULL_39_14 TaxID=1798383 RepID=A0A1F5ZYC9_9BACT|nr:MAG: hypothetical protein A3D78_04030 [Candidatus Gottesmanbacteria bacterium RIFCSPHIGHO2_02_FULL_39_14]
MYYFENDMGELLTRSDILAPGIETKPQLPGGQIIFMRGGGGGGTPRNRQEGPPGKNKSYLNEQDEEAVKESLKKADNLLTNVERIIERITGEIARTAGQIQQIEGAEKLGEEAPRN